ncbi:hypothetical protein LCGC14_1935400 [marine sediment metagenome]|uniref:Uncharacterized protein n=1 Tax=marine sediment metagenome TaxID=412755 RepID=A0A0F9I0E9_9ZZZZ
MKCCDVVCLSQSWGCICTECETEYDNAGIKKDTPEGYFTSEFNIPIPKSKFYRMFSLKEQLELQKERGAYKR